MEQYRGVDKYIVLDGPVDQSAFLDASAKHAVSRSTIVGWKKKVPGSGAFVSMAREFFAHVLGYEDPAYAQKSAEALVALLGARTSKATPLDFEPVPLLNEKGVIENHIVGSGTWVELMALVDFADYDVHGHVSKKATSGAAKTAKVKAASAPVINADKLAMLFKAKANVTSSAGSTYSMAPHDRGHGADSMQVDDRVPRLTPVVTTTRPGPAPPASMPTLSRGPPPPPPGAMPTMSQGVTRGAPPPPPAAMPTLSVQPV